MTANLCWNSATTHTLPVPRTLDSGSLGWEPPSLGYAEATPCVAWWPRDLRVRAANVDGTCFPCPYSVAILFLKLGWG